MCQLRCHRKNLTCVHKCTFQDIMTYNYTVQFKIDMHTGWSTGRAWLVSKEMPRLSLEKSKSVAGRAAKKFDFITFICKNSVLFQCFVFGPPFFQCKQKLQ